MKVVVSPFGTQLRIFEPIRTSANHTFEKLYVFGKTTLQSESLHVHT